MAQVTAYLSAANRAYLDDLPDEVTPAMVFRAGLEMIRVLQRRAPADWLGYVCDPGRIGALIAPASDPDPEPLPSAS